MSVLIKGMEMPKCCQDCPLNYDQMACVVTGTRWWSDSMVLMNFDSEKERLCDCPLIEVKTPHGRLGDLDKLKSKFRHGNGDSDADSAWISTIRRFITQADTIIEAEGVGNDNS